MQIFCISHHQPVTFNRRRAHLDAKTKAQIKKPTTITIREGKKNEETNGDDNFRIVNVHFKWRVI